MDGQTTAEKTTNKKFNRCPWCEADIKKELKECPECNSLLFEQKRSVEDRLKKVKQLNYGQILLREKEYLFDEIYKEQDLNAQIKFFTAYSFMFSAIYGIFLGCYAGGWQIISSGLKLPLILFGTLAICLPALFTFNMLLGSKLSLKQTLSTLLIANYMMSTILLSFAPILFFFTISTETKSFFSILNIGFCIIAGSFGVALLWRGMKFLTLKSGYEPNMLIIRIWSIIYMFVGTQFAWILKPFIGDRGDFMLFREVGGNFYIYLLKLFSDLF